MSKIFSYIIVLLMLFSVTASAQPKASPKQSPPDDRYAVFYDRETLEYGVPIFNKIPFLSQKFSKKVVHDFYVWDGMGTVGVISPDGRYFLTGNWDGKISLWNFDEPEKSRPRYVVPDHVIRKSLPDLKHPIHSQIFWLAFNRDGSRFAAGCLTSPILQIKEKKRFSFSLSGLFGGDTYFETVDDQIDFFISHIVIYETEMGNCIQTIEVPEEMDVYRGDFSPCGRYLAYCCRGQENGMVRVFDLDQNEQLFEKTLPQLKVTGKITYEGERQKTGYEAIYPDGVTAMVFSPDSRSLVITLSRSGTVILNATNGDVLGQWENMSFDNATSGFSPDGTQFFIAGNHVIRLQGKTHAQGKVFLWDFASRQLLREWTIGTEQKPERIVSAAFSRDVTQLLTAQSYKWQEKKWWEKNGNWNVTSSISFWNAGSGELVKTVPCEKGFSGETPLIAENRPLYNNAACRMMDSAFAMDFDFPLEEMTEELVTNTSSEFHKNVLW